MTSSFACIFCAIVAGDAPSHVVAESDRALAFLDINPAVEGHALVVPKAHADDIWDLDPEDGGAMWSLVHDVSLTMLERLRPDGLTLFQANRKAGWQDVFHFHLHVLPRWEGDRLVKPWEMTPGDPEQLAALATRLSAAP